MDTPNIPLDGTAKGGSNDFSGHWQPALRPDSVQSSRNHTSLVSGPAEGGYPFPPALDNDVSDLRELDTTIPPSIEKPGPQPLHSSRAPAESTEKPKSNLHEFDERPGSDHASNVREEGAWVNSQNSLKSPLVGLSWSNSRAGFGEGDTEMSSDEDTERLDPAWGITRMDSAQVMRSVNRTSSFPDFGSTPVSATHAPAAHLNMTEVEQIMQEQDEMPSEDENFAPSSSHDATAITMQAESNVGESGQHVKSERAGDAVEQAESGFTHEDEQDTSQARFDEGVPLISSEEEEEPQPELKIADVESRDIPFQSSTTEEEASFFDNFGFSTTNPPGNPAHLDRKATSDVLDSLHFSANDPPDSPVRAGTFDQLQEEDDEEFDFTKLTTGESAVERTTQVDDAEDMWKAALADDEFLVEDPDDLLPDSPPDSPSSFLGPLRDDNAVQAEQPAPSLTPKRDSRPDFARQSSSNPYAPHQPSTSDLTQLSPTTYSNVGLTRPGLAPMNSFQQHLQQRPVGPQATQSFVDQSKGGYKSPYDLPLELSKPRRRVQAPLPSPALKTGPPPPPRSSSMSSDNQLQSPFTPTNTSFPNIGRMPSAQAPPTSNQRRTSVTSPPQPPSSARPSSTTFFEELPMTSRPRPPTGPGRYTPQQNVTMPPPQLLPRSPPSRQDSQSQASPPRTITDPYAQYQLRPPERLDPYANVPLQAPPIIPAATSIRYSPAPVTSQLGPKPSPSPRYSPAPPPPASSAPVVNRYASHPIQPSEPLPGTMAPTSRHASQPTTNPPPTNLQPFQPRTSSPLAYHGRPANEQPRPVPPPTDRNASASYLPDFASSFRAPGQAMPGTSAPRPDVSSSSPPRASFLPPKRSQTQSPGKRGPITSFPTLSENTLNRPASVHSQMPPMNAFPQHETFPPPRPNVRPRGLTQNFEFIAPNDGQQMDELQRWKGAPIFHFGFGGSTISSFPKHTPRYAGGMSAPMIKPSAGEVVLRSAKDVLPLSEQTSTFPGPLRSKSKKKEVLSWLTSYITVLEQGHSVGADSQQLPNPQRRHDEKVLLWKIVRALVEHDGVLDTGAEARKSVNTILTPELFSLDESTATQHEQGGDFNGIYRPAGSIIRSDPIDPVAVDGLRKSLLRGEREKAVWSAVDNRLWAHALLISSTLDRKVWKQVVQEFVRQEVKIIGANTESLAAVYEIFAGNLEESIDELVPPSARAGLQMVSKVDSAGPMKNALDGLDSWKETLGLVLNNRSPDDALALAALGRLLASYGRVEAAHVCYIFSRGPTQPNIFGGADDPQANVVLLGADHQGRPLTFFHDEDAVLLTEVYEFATSVLASGAMSSALPHFHVYKLQRAVSLAENGRKADAQAYVDGIAGSLKSNTKMSPYFNPMFFAELDELSNRLRQAPMQSSSSWLAKPSIEKVSGSVWNKFSSFVVGDDSDAESKGSGKDANHEFGPFAKVTGTPELSRSGSQTDLYGSYPTNGPPSVPNTIAGSRYAPNGIQTARSSSELTRGRASLDSQRSPPSTSMGQTQRLGSFEPPSSFAQHGYVPQATNLYQSLSQSPPTTRYQATPPQTSYIPNAVHQESPKNNYSARQPDTYIPTPPPEQTQTSYMPTAPPPADPLPPPAEQPSYGGYPSATPAEAASDPDIPEQPSYNAGYDPPDQPYGYEPPASTGYVPYQPEPESDPDLDGRPKAIKKKSFMDDDDDDFPRISNGSSTGAPPPSSGTPNPSGPDNDAEARKRANDAAADAAFRAAAEADEARAKEREKSGSVKGKGWGIGGWFGGKKPDSLDASSSGAKGAEPKVHRAHLGESKMTLHYDKELKKWVDPNNPETMQTKSATPPPPRMGPGARGLTPSASMPAFGGSAPGSGPGSTGPPSGPPSRTGTPGDGPVSGLPPNLLQRPGSSGLSGPPSGTGTPPPGTGLPPPSRPNTGMSNASSIDDLLGPPSGAGRRTVKGKKGGKGGRYIDVMAQ